MSLGPAKLEVSQRWTFKDRTWQIVQLAPEHATLRRVYDNERLGELRTVDRERLRCHYTYVGEFAVPEGYSIHKIEFGAGGHCYKTPAGNVNGPPAGQKWTWRQARDAAAEHARSSNSGLAGGSARCGTSGT